MKEAMLDAHTAGSQTALKKRINAS